VKRLGIPDRQLFMTPTTPPRNGRHRRVTVVRVLSLLLQALLAGITFRQIHAVQTGAEPTALHLAGATVSMMIAILHGVMGLPGMLKAALGSIAYRVAVVFTGAAIALISATFLMVFFLPAAGASPFGFFVPRAGSFDVSLEGGLGTLIAFGAVLLMTIGYSYGAGLLSVLLVSRSDEKLQQHWMFKDLDKQSDWDLPEV
jgi:hypothetical protein